MTNPASRAWWCYQENPESPTSPVCRAVVAAAGTQPLYDWNEVNIGDAAGRHRTIIPDGKLCSAGRDKYRGLDLARADWPTTTLPTSGRFTFRFKGTAPHRGTFELYVTRDGFDPAKPLAWADLEAQPFLRSTDPPLVDGVYQLAGDLPGNKRGRHLIYTIWQRSDSPEAFYTCSDVVFGAVAGDPAPPLPSPAASRPAPASPAPASPSPTSPSPGSPSPTPAAPSAQASPSATAGEPSTGTSPAPGDVREDTGNPGDDQLPRTGAVVWRWALLGVTLVALGFVTLLGLLLTRRPKPAPKVSPATTSYR
ncbi:lytic polysaccharide monooxygenase [Catellatospora sp. NEAU-YM18]|nr:lytic polysaccharide monooxygenase [Catellatospora tritici]